jgi:hypothetical protein
MKSINDDTGLIVILLFAISLNTCQSCRCSSDPQLDELVQIRKNLDNIEKQLKKREAP